MKKTILILSAIIFLFAGCHKDAVIEPSKVVMGDETVERGWDYIKISGEYDYPVALEAMTLYLSEKADMSGAKTYNCILDGKTFSVKADGLKNGIVYYYQYEYDNGYVKEKGEVLETNTFINGYDWVDLGLPSGLKWATCNVGASSPEDYGDYYAWGETETKSTYTSDNCSTYGVQMGDISGNAQYDVARKKWGGSWRMPMKAEFEELKNKCTWKWTTQNGVKGYKVTGPNSNSIFLPAAGYRYGSSLDNAGERGYYWSSTPDESNSSNAYYLYFNSSDQSVDWIYRSLGQSVRPVSE